MEYKIIEQPEIKILGISIRTTNEDNQCMTDIPKLWEKFYSGNMAGKIANKLNDEILAVYYDYEKDFTKPYSYLIGFKVADSQPVVNDLTSLVIPAAKYAVFTAKGDFPANLGQTWQRIWGTDIPRSYRYDFELYDEKARTTKNEEIKIFIGIN